MQFAGQTDIGLVRKTNQDAYNAGSLSENAVWAVVCDGMGGANGGNIASETAIDAGRDGFPGNQGIAGFRFRGRQ